MVRGKFTAVAAVAAAAATAAVAAAAVQQPPNLSTMTPYHLNS